LPQEPPLVKQLPPHCRHFASDAGRETTNPVTALGSPEPAGISKELGYFLEEYFFVNRLDDIVGCARVYGVNHIVLCRFACNHDNGKILVLLKASGLFKKVDSQKFRHIPVQKNQVYFVGEQLLQRLMTVRGFDKFTGDFYLEKGVFYDVSHNPRVIDYQYIFTHADSALSRIVKR
jgi:hypothetical protein